MVLGIFGEAHRDYRASLNGGPELIQIGQCLTQDLSVVDAGGHDDLSVKLDAMLGELPQLRNDFGGGWIPEEVPAYHWVGGVHRHIQRRQTVFLDALYVVRFEVGQGRKIPVAEGEAVVIVADVEHIAEAIGQSVDKAEVTAIGTPANPGRLERDPHRLAERPLDVELD